MYCPECGSSRIIEDKRFDVFCQRCGTVLGEPMFLE